MRASMPCKSCATDVARVREYDSPFGPPSSSRSTPIAPPALPRVGPKDRIVEPLIPLTGRLVDPGQAAQAQRDETLGRVAGRIGPPNGRAPIDEPWTAS